MYIILLEDYISKIKPNYVLYLIGSNDIGRDDLGEFDIYKIHTRYTSIKDFLIKKSEIIGFFQNLYRVMSLGLLGLKGLEPLLFFLRL